MNKIYFPYKSDQPKYKFYILTNKNKKVYFGANGYEHYTEGHLDDKRKLNYIRRHMNNEDWTNPNTAGFWSFWYLWFDKTYNNAYNNIKNIIFKNNLV
jgi:hypothetical protein